MTPHSDAGQAEGRGVDDEQGQEEDGPQHRRRLLGGLSMGPPSAADSGATGTVTAPVVPVATARGAGGGVITGVGGMGVMPLSRRSPSRRSDAIRGSRPLRRSRRSPRRRAVSSTGNASGQRQKIILPAVVWSTLVTVTSMVRAQRALGLVHHDHGAVVEVPDPLARPPCPP